MKIEKAKHALAIVRATLRENGLTQGEMANLLGCSIDYIKSLETGRETMPPGFAKRIQTKTGVDAQWLLKDDIKKPIRFFLGSKWLDENEKLQKMTVPKSFQIMESGRKTQNIAACTMRFLSFWEVITKLISIAAKVVKDKRFGDFINRLRSVAAELEADFGCDAELDAARLQAQMRLRESINPREKKVGRIVPAVLDLKPLSEAVSGIFFPAQEKEREGSLPAPRG